MATVQKTVYAVIGDVVDVVGEEREGWRVCVVTAIAIGWRFGRFVDEAV